MALFVTEAGGKPVGFTWNNQIRRWMSDDGGMLWTDEAFKDRFIPFAEAEAQPAPEGSITIGTIALSESSSFTTGNSGVQVEANDPDDAGFYQAHKDDPEEWAEPVPEPVPETPVVRKPGRKPARKAGQDG